MKLEGAPSAVITAPGRLMSGYGYRTDPFSQNTSFHQGVDIEAPRGTAVHTPGPGVVTFAGVRGGYGRVVEVALDDNHKIHFSHLNEVAVVQGEALKAGDIVGTVGSTGRSSGPHLHLEFYRDGRAHDPATVQGLKLTAGPAVTPPAIVPAPQLKPAPPTSSEKQAGERADRKTDLIDIDGRRVDEIPLRHGFDAIRVIDDRNILYRDNYGDHYLVTLKEACRGLTFFPSWSLQLRASHSYEVRPRAGQPCDVARIEKVDDARSKKLRDAAQRPAR
jgi:hypothetical protein